MMDIPYRDEGSPTTVRAFSRTGGTIIFMLVLIEPVIALCFTVGASGRLGRIIIVAIISLIQPVISRIYTPSTV